MKKYSILISIVLGLSFILYSCDTDNDGAKYRPKTDGVTFLSAKATAKMEYPDESFKIRLSRLQTKGTLDVPITTVDPSGLFSVPATASFADGEGYVDLDITFSDIAVGARYNLELSFPEEYIGERDSLVSLNETVITVYKDYLWEDYGEGTIASSIFGFTDDVEIKRAVQNPHAYLIIDPYVRGYPIAFELSDDETAVTEFFIQPTGYVDSRYGMTFLRYQSSTIVGKQIRFNFDFIVYIGNSTGSFGTFQEIIDMP